MAIRLPQGFQITSRQPIDTRLVLTKAEMSALRDSLMPDVYVCTCKDDGKLYIWNKNFEVSTELGRFKPYDELLDLVGALNKILEDPTKKAELEASIGLALPGAVATTMSDPEEAERLSNAMFETEHFSVNTNNKIDLAFDLIQAIDGN